MSLADQIDAVMGKSGGMIGREMSRYGVTLAKVTNINDPDKFNRVKCLPIGSKNEEETDWCYVMAPMGGKERGLFLFPQVDDQVVLAYIDEDPHRPIVLGSYWNTEVKPPYSVTDGKAQDYCLKTPKKIELELHDEDKKQKVTLTMPSGTVLTIDDEAQKVTVKDKNGKNALEMDLKGGNVELKADKKLTLSAGKTTITLESGGNITQKGSGTVSVEGANIKGKANSSVGLEASGSVAIKGASVEAKANGALKLNASGIAELKGTMVKIN